MKYKIGVFMLCILFLLFCQGCCDDDAINVNERIQSNAGGIFCIENVRSKELIKTEPAISINIGGTNKKMDARVGDVIKIAFLPQDKYKEYKFDVSYTLPNDQTVSPREEENYSYNYTVPNTLSGDYAVSMSAKYEKDDSKITAYGGITICVKAD